jgi:hypothetical protein
MIISNSGADQVEEFSISLDGVGERTFLSVPGGPHTEFKIPFSRAEVEEALGDYSPNRVSTDPLESFGSTLFNSLFSGDRGRRLWERLAEVERNNRGLRLRILSNLERTQHLPWELLFDPSRGDFMSLSGRLALVRTRPDSFNTMPLETLPCLRILAVEADPTGVMRTREDLRMLQQFANLYESRVKLTVIEKGTLAAVESQLRLHKYDVFHFAGSGEVLPYISKRGGIRQVLRLIGDPSSDSLLDRQHLGEMLHNAGVRLAVLNACHTDWIARSLAKYIPSAIGLRESVQDNSCLTLCDSLYCSILAGSSLDLAVTATRQAMDHVHPGTGDWCKLIFYLQKPNGLFLSTSTGATEKATRSTIPRENKEIAKLMRLLDVYQSNLAAIERRVGGSSVSVESLREQSNDLQLKVKTIKQQLVEAANRENIP